MVSRTDAASNQNIFGLHSCQNRKDSHSKGCGNVPRNRTMFPGTIVMKLFIACGIRRVKSTMLLEIMRLSAHAVQQIPLGNHSEPFPRQRFERTLCVVNHDGDRRFAVGTEHERVSLDDVDFGL